MKVIATQPGHDGLQIRQPGEHFEIPDHRFTPVWMTPDVPPVEPRRSWLERILEFLQRDIRRFF